MREDRRPGTDGLVGNKEFELGEAAERRPYRPRVVLVEHDVIRLDAVRVEQVREVYARRDTEFVPPERLGDLEVDLRLPVHVELARGDQVDRHVRVGAARRQAARVAVL